MVTILFIGSFLRRRGAGVSLPGVSLLREPGRDCALEFTTFDFSGESTMDYTLFIKNLVNVSSTLKLT